MTVRIVDALDRIDGFRQTTLPSFPGDWAYRSAMAIMRPQKRLPLGDWILEVAELQMRQGRLWEAQKIYSHVIRRYLEHQQRNAQPIDHCVRCLRQLSEGVVDEEEATVRLLVVMSTLADLVHLDTCGCDLPSSLQALQAEALSEATFGLKALDQIDTPLVETRAYEILATRTLLARSDFVTRDTTLHAQKHRDYQLNIRLCCLQMAMSGRSATPDVQGMGEEEIKGLVSAESKRLPTFRPRDRNRRRTLSVRNQFLDRNVATEKRVSDVTSSWNEAEDTLGFVALLRETRDVLDLRGRELRHDLATIPAFKIRMLHEMAPILGGPGMQMPFVRSYEALMLAKSTKPPGPELEFK